MKKTIHIAVILAVLLLGAGCSDMINDLQEPGIKSLDVMILLDLTASMNEELNLLNSDFSLLPGDYQVGIAGFGDYPIDPYGDPDDYPYQLFQPLSPDMTETQTALSSMSVLYGVDAPEAQYEALYQIATGEGQDTYIDPSVTGWRKNSQKAVIIITDANCHDSIAHPGRGYTEALAALQSRKIKVMGILTGPSDITTIITATGGQYYNLPSTGAGINTKIQEIVLEFLTATGL